MLFHSNEMDFPVHNLVSFEFCQGTIQRSLGASHHMYQVCRDAVSESDYKNHRRPGDFACDKRVVYEIWDPSR